MIKRNRVLIVVSFIVILSLTTSPSSLFSWTMDNSTEVELDKETIGIPASDYNDLKTSCYKIINAPKVFMDAELGYCSIYTNLPTDILEKAGIDLEDRTDDGSPRESPSFDNIMDILIEEMIGSGTRSSGNVYVVCTVPSLWTQGQNVPVRFYLYNDGHTSAYVTLEFTSYDKDAQEEFHDVNTVEGYTTVRGLSEKVKYLYLDTTDTPIGIWGGRAEAGSAASYSKDFGYTFVQKFDVSPILPPNDAMAQESQNPNYYWEGLSAIDGFSIADECALYHSDDWSICWLAADLIDLNLKYDQYQMGRVLNRKVHSTMTVYTDDHTEYSVQCSWSDYRIITMGYKGVCDEFANLEITLLRALGVPARRIGGLLPNGRGHAWLELWAYCDSAWTWIHADPTWRKFNNPGCYNGASWVDITSGWDDCVLYNGCTGDGDNTNGLLANHSGSLDMLYEVLYDGPNDY